MNRLTLLFCSLFLLILVACGGGANENADPAGTPSTGSTSSTGDYDATRGEGKWNADNVNVTPALNQELASNGEKISNVKCASCHKMTDERLVGPGWKGVTTRHKPEWIMNFITNPDPMIDKDPKLQAQLELCLVRMPNQSLTDDDARAVVEYMRKVDGVQ